MTVLESYRDILTSEFQRRQDRNPRYSLRSFAGFLGMSPAHLSQVLSGKRALSFKAAESIASRLSLPPVERQRLLGNLGTLSTSQDDADVFRRLREQEFAAIANWQDYALLGLANLDSNKADSRWISERLGIPVAQARATLNRLTELGIIKIEGGSFYQTGKPLATTQDVKSAAIRQFHRGLLQKAADSLDTVETAQRDFSAITMAIDPEKLSLAKKRIQLFRRQLCRELESGPQKDVYTLAVQLFPLTVKKGRSK